MAFKIIKKLNILIMACNCGKSRLKKEGAQQVIKRTSQSPTVTPRTNPTIRRIVKRPAR